MGVANTYIGNINQIAASIQTALSSGWQKIETKTLTSEADTFLFNTGLDLIADGMYHLYGCLFKGTDAPANLSLMVNGDLVETNYHSYVAADANDSLISTLEPAATYPLVFDILITQYTGNYPTAIGRTARSSATSVAVNNGSWSHNTSATNVTSINIGEAGHGAGAAFAVGSSVSLYKRS